jgi:predicted nucleotidyltransferase/uncharacterized protein with HEPN domain
MAELVRLRPVLERIAQTHGASNLRVAGSVAHGTAGPDSDIDLVVDIDDERDLMDVIELILDLQNELGREVDVLAISRSSPPGAMGPGRAIMADAVPIPAAFVDNPPAGSDDRDRRLLGELRRSLAFVRSYIEGGEGTFMRNEMAVDAVKHRLAEIADACRRLSPEFKQRHPHVRWRAFGGLPVGIRHGPRGCWEIVTTQLKPLDDLLDREVAGDRGQPAPQARRDA